MSGMKRRVQPAGSNSGTVQMYDPQQYSNLQTPWRPQELQTPNENNWYPSFDHQTNYWQGNQPNTVAPVHQYYNNETPAQATGGGADPWNWNWGEEDNSNAHKENSVKVGNAAQWSMDSQLSQGSSEQTESDKALSRSSTTVSESPIQENHEVLPTDGYKRPSAFAAKPAEFYSFNLETVPDNSEHPDPVLPPPPPFPPKPENNETPISDRNQYLETGQLESRLVLGQQNPDELPPPPGLSRMVLGQTEPPASFQRIVQGEARSTTIGGAASYNSTRETNADGANNDTESTDNIAKLTGSVRDLALGEKPDNSSLDDTEPEPEPQQDKHKNRRKYNSRSRRYEEDADYYSDKEKDRRRDGRDYDRKYSSLKRDEKDRRRREHRKNDYGRERRNDYYGRYENDYDDGRRSRPTSRSDSMHDSYRQDHDHHRHRDRDHYRRQREPFNPYMQGFPYDPYNSYYQQYHYYENLRRTNPQAYAEWYRKYYQHASTVNYVNDDRASVHSGRSSANEDRYLHQSYYNQSALSYYREQQAFSYGPDESTGSRQLDQTDSSLYLEETPSQRLTPAKFATPHIKASLNSGQLVKILPNYPLDGQIAAVEISNVHETLSNDDGCYRELAEYPGPLIKGVTHKKTIIEYCESKIGSASSSVTNDVNSYVLMWELLILLLRQNGMVVGTDIAELLMKDSGSRRGSLGSHSSLISGALTPDNNNMPETVMKEETVTNKFRNYLIYGSEKEALEWAMKHGLWGHALFLASKLDKRTYANVMTRFANGLSMNDPLQTLYQLLSGKVPSAVTCIVDEKWGDWRPHLAMILSNTTQHPELDQKAITTLGDTLLSRGSFFAAQFCYLMVQVGFSRYGSEDAKLVLLGSNHNKPFTQFATNEAIIMTEIYEYACSLNTESFILPEFLPYKYLLATRLADFGLLEKSLAYLEKVASAVIQSPTLAQPSLVTQTCELADRLQYYDALKEHGQVWLEDLKAIEKDFSLGLIKHESVENFLSDNLEQDANVGQNEYETTTNNAENWQPQYQQSWPQFGEQTNQLEYSQVTHTQEVPSAVDSYHNQDDYWTKQWNNEQPPSTQMDMANHQAPNDYWTKNEDVMKQPPSPPRKQSLLPVKQKQQQPDKPNSNSGWFGGIFSKWSLLPKNQMKLPDDKNPTIIWDETNKRWVNKDSEGDEGTREIRAPPPKMKDMAFSGRNQAFNNNPVPQQVAPELPVSQSAPNMFKLQKSRNLKKSYVDVFNPSSTQSTASNLAVPETIRAPNNFNYFVPAPIDDPNAPTDFLTPAPMFYEENNGVQ